LIVQSQRERNKEVMAEYEAEYAVREPRSVQRMLLNVGPIAGGLVLLVSGFTLAGRRCCGAGARCWA
jgi:D-Tyr-tRNAtyr deacylase